MLKITVNHSKTEGFSLKEVDFQLKKGQILLLAGLNGAGKTTLLKTLAGVYPENQGNFRFGSGKLLGSHVEYIPPGLQNSLPLSVNHFLTVSLGKIFKSAEDENRIRQIAKFLQIQDLLERDLSRLSSGETVRILLAKALLSRKPVILWDEPTSFLDLRYRRFLQKVILRLKSRKIWLISSHDYVWAKPMADFYLGLKRGKQVFLSTQLGKEELKKLLL